MAGKRTRQIQRTTSMSQLGGGGVMFSQGINGVAGLPFRGHSCPFDQELGQASMESCPEVWEMLPPAMEEQANNMAIDSMAEKNLSACHTPCYGAGAIASSHKEPVLDSESLTFSGVHQWRLSAHLDGKDTAATYVWHGRSNGGGSGRPAYFLDICYLCSKLLGHGRDVFIYRGDKAFCSAECRHMQIVADERMEKGVRTVA